MREGNLSPSAAWYFPALALAIAFGALTALGSKIATIFAFGAAGGLVMMFIPLHLVLGLFVILTFLVVGPLTSLADLQQALWAPYMISTVLLIRVPMERLQTSIVQDLPLSGSRHPSPLTWALIAYFTVMVVSLLVNHPPPLQGLIAAKLYVFAWGVFFLLVVSSISPESLKRLWRGFLLIAILQVPFALFQRLVEVPRRNYAMGGTALDAVVGTFPGTPNGGASGAFAMFLVFSMVLSISLWRNRLLSGQATVVVILAAVASMCLGEVKVIIVFLPLAFMVLQRREMIERPLQFVGMGVAMLVLLGGIFSLYRDAMEVRSGPQRTVTEHVEAAFNYVLDPNNVDFKTGAVGRGAALSLWYRDGRRTPQNFLVGYGPAASQDSSQNRGDVQARYYPLRTNTTTAAGMLWDLGVLGFASFSAVIVIAFFEALKLSNSAHIPAFHRSTLESSAALFAMVGVGLPYNNDMLITPPLQILFLIALAQVVYWHAREGTFKRPSTTAGDGKLLAPSSS
jgi:hypothetical protein